MKNDNIKWTKLDVKNLPEFGRMLVCNRLQAWAVDGVHKASDWRGPLFAYSDDERTITGLTHYSIIGDLPK